NDLSYFFQAEVLNFTGRPEDALRRMKQAMRLNPRYPHFYVPTLGVAYRLAGRYAEAVAALKEVLSRNPNFQPAQWHLAARYVQQWAFQQSVDSQTLAQALAEAQRLIASNDSYSRGHLVLGYVYLWQKQYEQAIAEMARAIALDPNLADGYMGLAEVFSRVS